MDSQDVSQEELEHRDMLMEQRTLAMACTHREPKIWMDQFSQNKWMLQLSFFDLINVQSNWSESWIIGDFVNIGVSSMNIGHLSVYDNPMNGINGG